NQTRIRPARTTSAASSRTPLIRMGKRYSRSWRRLAEYTAALSGTVCFYL
ncbi:MAG: hypothetical protein ACJAS1_004579, partial [Oleiphilaceae bacterium]